MGPVRIDKIVKILISDEDLVQNYARLKDQLLRRRGDIVAIENQYKMTTISAYDFFWKIVILWIRDEGSQATIKKFCKTLNDLEFINASEKIQTAFGGAELSENEQPLTWNNEQAPRSVELTENASPSASQDEPETRSLIRSFEFYFRSGFLNVFDFVSQSSSSVSAQSTESRGQTWNPVMFFTDNADKPNPQTVQILHDNLLSYFSEDVDKTIQTQIIKDKIIRVMIYKERLRSWTPKWWGAWHEFTVVEVKCSSRISRFWVFEKNSEGIFVQRVHSLEAAKAKKVAVPSHLLVGRIDVTEEGRPFEDLAFGDTVLDIFHYIHQEGYLTHAYHALNSNCHYFASLIFEAIAHKYGRRLRA